MKCPVCGLEVPADQKFCRSCGTSLSVGVRSFGETAAASAPSRWRPVVEYHEPQPRQKWVMYGFILLFIGVAIGVVGKMLLHQDMVTVVGVLACLAGMFFSAFPYLSPPRPRKYEVVPSAEPQTLTPAEPTNKLPQMSDIDFAPNVTEGTTELLKTPAVTQRDSERP